jgi:heat shock protein HtpX
LSILLGFYFSYGKLDTAVLNDVFSSSIISLPIIAIWFFIAVLFQRQIIFSFSGAIPITRQEDPEIYNIVENLCISR